MNQDESIALWRRGKDAWNAWAEEMLRQKAELEKSGTWNGDEPSAQWSDKSSVEWNDETRKWIKAALTDLSGLRFMPQALADRPRSRPDRRKKARSRPNPMSRPLSLRAMASISTVSSSLGGRPSRELSFTG